MLTIVNEDFFLLKGVVETLLNDLGIINYQLKEGSYQSFWHPKQVVCFTKNNTSLLTLGKIQPKIAMNFSVDYNLYFTEINISKLINLANPFKQYKPVPLYPPLIEDLSFVISRKTKIGNLINEIRNVDSLITNIEFRDKYKNIITLRITYQHQLKNLTSSEVRKIREKIFRQVTKKLGVKLKGS